MMQCCFSWVLRKCHRPLECGVILAEEYSEDALDLYDAELQKLRKYFKANKDVFSKVAEREELFQKFLMLEVLFEAFSLQWCSRKYEALVHLSFDGWVVAFGTVWRGLNSSLPLQIYQPIHSSGAVFTWCLIVCYFVMWLYRDYLFTWT